MSGMLEGSVYTCNVYVAGWRCDYENLRGHPGYYITIKISTQTGDKEEVSPKIRTSTPVCAAQPSLTFSYFTRSYILGNKTKRKKIFLYICIVVLFCFPTQVRTPVPLLD